MSSPRASRQALPDTSMQARGQRSGLEPRRRRGWLHWVVALTGAGVYLALVVVNLDSIRLPLASETASGLRVAGALSVPGVVLLALWWRRRSVTACVAAVAWALLVVSFATLYVLSSPAADARFLRSELDRMQTPSGARQISHFGGDGAFSGAGSFASSSYCVSGDPNSAGSRFRTAALNLESWDPPSNAPGTNDVGRIGRVSISVSAHDVATERGEDSTLGNLAGACGPDELTVVTVQLNSF